MPRKIPSFNPSEKPSLKGKNLADYKREVAVLYNELERRDRMIDELREKNEVLMKTALRAEAKVTEMERALRRQKS